MSADRSVTIRLRVASAEFNEAMTQAGMKVKIISAEIEGTGKKAGLSAKELDKLGFSADGTAKKFGQLREDVKKSDDANRSASKSSGLLGAAIVGLGSAIGPLSALAIGGAASLGMMGASGILAVKGVKREMEQGTAVGASYKAGLHTLQGDLSKLEQTAARGVLGPFNAAIRTAQVQMPFLNSEVARFSAQGGRVGGNVFTATLEGLRAMAPLTHDVGNYLEGLSQKALKFAGGGGLQRFTSWAQSQLPMVEHTLGSVAQAIIAITGASAPVGTISVEAMGLMADAINALPVGVLHTLVPLIAAGYLGFKAYTALAPAVATVRSMTAALKAYEVQQLMTAGVTQEAAIANSSAVGGLKLLGAGWMGASALALTAGVGIVIANNMIADHFRKTAASADDAEKVLLSIGRSSQVSSGQLKSLGVASGNLGSVMENAFHESNWTKLKDFQFGMGSIIKTPFNSATDDMKNFFKSWDGGLTKLVEDGQVNRAKSLLADMSRQTGESVETLLSKLPGYKSALDTLANTAAPVKLHGVLMASGDELDRLATRYHVTTSQAQGYVGLLGIMPEQIDKSTIAEARLHQALNVTATAYATANQSTDEYLGALDAFSKSAHTAADRGALIGATLKYGNGDALNYASSMAAAAAANKGFVDAFDSARTSAHDAGLAFDDARTGVVNLATGTINYKNAAAQPLIAGLQAMQDAAMKAAGATYQHELATRGGAAAAKDAADQYYAQTHGALMDEYQQLGLTKDQAKRLADTYFSMPKDIKTQVASVGADKTAVILDRIGALLARLTNQPWVSEFRVAVNQAYIDSVQAKIDNLAQARTVEIYLRQANSIDIGVSGRGTAGKATGGWISGPGTGTSDSVPIMGSNGEFVSTAVASSRNGAALEAGNRGARLVALPGYADGGFIGGGPAFVGVTTPSRTASRKAARSGSTKAARAAKAAKSKAATAAKAAAAKRAQVQRSQAAIRWTVSSDLPKVAQSALGSASQVAAAMAKLINDVHTATTRGLGSAALIRTLQRENARMIGLAKERAGIAGQLKAANAKYASLRADFNAEAGKVADSIRGNFDVGTAGNNGGYTSMTTILRDLNRQAAQAKKFTDGLAALKKSGLNKSLIQQMAESGVGTAGANVAALAGASKGQIAQINGLYQQVDTNAKAAGKQVAGSMYQAGLDSAAGYINGLKSKDKAVAAAASSLAHLVTAQVRKDLGIRSPSTVAFGMGGHTADGYALGLTSRLGTVKAAASGLANAAAVHFTPGAGARPVTSTTSRPMLVELSASDRRLLSDAVAAFGNIEVSGRLTADGQQLSAVVSQGQARRMK